MNAVLSKQAIKVLARIDAPTRERIAQAILKLPKGDIRPVQGHTGLYRLRVGGWRILYSYADAGLLIIDIGPRGGVYK